MLLQKPQQKLQKLNRILNNSLWANYIPEKKEADYYALYKTYWRELQILIDRINFHYLWTSELLHSEDERRGFERGLDTLMMLLDKNVAELDQDKEIKNDTSSKKLF